MPSMFDDLPPIISREQAESIVSPVASELCAPCFAGIDAWRAMVEQDAARPVVITPRVWAGIVHCYVVRDALERFSDREAQGLRVRPENESLMLIFSEILVGRFKKVDENFRPSNSPTVRQFQYERQTLKLEGLPDESTNVTIGYLPDEIGSEIRKITMICWRMHRLEWAVPLYDSEAGRITLFGPIEPLVSPTEERRRTIRPKIEPKKAEGQEE